MPGDAVEKTKKNKKNQSNMKMTLDQKIELGKLKKQVSGGLEQTISALEKIHAKKLYMAEAETFDEFCNKNWGWTANYVRRLLSAKEVLKSVPIGTITKESQARALAKVAPAQRAEVVVEARKSGSLTAKAITKAAQEIDRPRITAGPEPVFDELGIKVPANAMPMWSRRNEVLAMMKDLSEIKTQIASSQKADDLLYVEVCNSTLADLSRCREGVSYALPYTVCPDCKGQTIDKCGLCKGRGVISKVLYQTVPADVRAMRERQALKKK